MDKEEIIQKLTEYMAELNAEAEAEEDPARRQQTEMIAAGVGQALNIVRNGHPYII